MKKESIKKLLYYLFNLIILFTLMGCVYIPSEDDPKLDSFDTFPEEFIGILNDKDIYITSFGQAIDIENFLVMVDHVSSISYQHDNLLQVNDVVEDAVVLAVVGCSIKGLEGAGITIQEELTRAQSFINAKNENKLSLIVWHIGGMMRRGSTSDQIIELTFGGADFSIFIKDGNEDNFLAKILTEKKVPGYQINYLSSIVDALNLLVSNGAGD